MQFLKKGQFENKRFAIKRDDLINPLISGNKWRKLKYTLTAFDSDKYDSITTFGGAFSNHIVATAAICQQYDIPSRAFIRTDEIDIKNPTLSICRELGMKLIPMDRATYIKKDENSVLDVLKLQNPKSMFVPEGGSAKTAILGIQECVQEIKKQAASFEYYVTSLGTGATASGMLLEIDKSEKLLICPAIKGVKKDGFVEMYSALIGNPPSDNFDIVYQHGAKAYAKKDMDLFRFIQQFYIDHDVLLDPIYTGKAMFALLATNQFHSSNSFCFVHTGGIQAWNGYFYRFPKLVEELPKIYEAMSKYNSTLLSK